MRLHAGNGPASGRALRTCLPYDNHMPIPDLLMPVCSSPTFPDDLVSPSDDFIARHRRLLEARLDGLLPAADSGQMATAMRAATLAPGKRLRPLFMLALGADLGCRSPAVLDLACAVEMVHAASLVLDDLPCMDDAVMRRGRLTTHRQFGEDVAMLTSVALLSRAFGVVATAAGMPAAQRAAAVAALAHAVGTDGLVGGQYLDLREGTSSRNTTSIAHANHLKTSALLEAGFALCALCADAADGPALSRIAYDLGQAYQLLDDLHDCAAVKIDAKDMGRDTGKSTLVNALGRPAAEQRLAAHLANVLDQARGLGDGRLAAFVDALFKDLSRPVAVAPA